MQAKEKANQARMFSENQKLGNNVRFAPLLNTRLWEWFGYSLYRLKRKNDIMKVFLNGFWHVKKLLVWFGQLYTDVYTY